MCDPADLALTVTLTAAGLSMVGVGTFAATILLIRRFM